MTRTITTERITDDDLAVYRETESGFEFVGYTADVPHRDLVDADEVSL